VFIFLTLHDHLAIYGLDQVSYPFHRRVVELQLTQTTTTFLTPSLSRILFEKVVSLKVIIYLLLCIFKAKGIFFFVSQIYLSDFHEFSFHAYLDMKSWTHLCSFFNTIFLPFNLQCICSICWSLWTYKAEIAEDISWKSECFYSFGKIQTLIWRYWCEHLVR